jgi:hypothetical protein
MKGEAALEFPSGEMMGLKMVIVGWWVKKSIYGLV